MRGPAKKANSREAFAAVFEEQTRRFSAFELLGLSTEHLLPAQRNSNEAESLGNLSPSSRAPRRTSEAEALRPDPEREVLIPNPQVEVHVQYRPTQALAVDPQHLDQTVRPDLGLTPLQLGLHRQTQDILTFRTQKLLAPLQWAVWRSLQRAETSGRTTSYRQIAKETNATADGVKKAVNVIQKEGGIIKKEIVRSAAEQGFRVTLNREAIFRAATLNEAKGVLKRGIHLGPTGVGGVQDLRPDGLCMYVCKNVNIKQTDLAALLRIPPLEWKLREQTLVQIADALPNMTAIEFRLSLNYLVEQGKTAREPIRNHNAWAKAAFEKNKGPLVTEREIEVRFEQSALKRDVPRPANSADHHTEDSELLRLYLACTPDERIQIDLMAEGKAAPLLRVVAEDKRAGVLEEARREAARAFLSKKS